MLRRLPYMFGLLAAFGLGFLLVSMGLDDGLDGPEVTLTLDRAVVMRSLKDARPLPPQSPGPRIAERPVAGEPPVAPQIQIPPRSYSTIRPLTRLVSFASAPFPYDGAIPRTQKPFLNVKEDGRHGHKTFSGRVYWQDETYSDKRVLLHVPAGFDPSKPAVLVFYFHGHGASLERDVVLRQRLPEQISLSGINAVLVAPQFAVNARDSSAGNFWTRDGVRNFVEEVSLKLAAMHGDLASRKRFATMPAIIVGYSGGYMPTAWTLASHVLDKRLAGVVLLDGLYGELGKFASWIKRNRSGFFLSAHTGSTAKGVAGLKKLLRDKDIGYRTTLGPRLNPGSVTFIAVDEKHRDYVTQAWTAYPVADLLNRITGTAARKAPALSASLAPVFRR